MRDWRSALVSPSGTMRDAVAAMSESGWQIALVADSSERLLGVLTDGDIRRALLHGRELASPIAEVMNPTPVTMPAGSSGAAIKATMSRDLLHFVPLVDADGRVTGIATIDDLVGEQERPNPVVIMAGGLGKRLHPLTENYPKPMLHVGDRPILETIVTSFADQGFRDIHLAVNFRSDIVESHFGDGSRFGVRISYIREPRPLGTAGALSLLDPKPDLPVIVMNGDLLTRMSCDALLEFHARSAADATMVVREAAFDLPFGVVTVEGSSIVQIAEKPQRTYLVNAGIYVISPDLLRSIPADEYLDMPALFTGAIEDGRKTAAFPLHEYWIDIGRLEELERAQAEWNQ